MSLAVREEKGIEAPAGRVFTGAVAAISALEGKIEEKDGSSGRIKAKFDKKILGKVLGQRTQVELAITGSGGEASQVVLVATPLDAVGRPLLFGERKGVTRTVITWFWAHLEHQLKNTA